MSLQIWLPLNGNLTNNGLSNAILSNSETSYSTGKITTNSCVFNGTSSYVAMSSTELYNCFKGGGSPFTIAFWIYNSETSGSRVVIFGDYGLGGAISFNLEINGGSASNNAIRFYWGGSPDYTANNTTTTINSWTHIAICYNGTAVKFYKNGILTDTYSGALDSKQKTSGSFYLGRDNRTGTTAFSGRLNDFRVYDSCLTDSEIKDIAMGLVCNIPLSNAYAEPAVNFDPFKLEPTFSYTQTKEYGFFYGKYCWHFICSGSSTGWFGLYSAFVPTSVGYAIGDVITRSCQLYIPSGQNTANWYGVPYAFENCSVTSKKCYDTSKCNTWQNCSCTATITVTGSNYLYYFFAGTNGSARIEFYITDLQCEKNNHATPYTSSTRADTILYDVSGYQTNFNIAQASAPAVVEYNSPRYNKCSYFTTASYAELPSLACSGFSNNYTISWWANIASWGGTMCWGFGSGSLLNFYDGLYWNNGDGSGNPFYKPGTTTIIDRPPVNSWHHLVVTGDGTSTKLYIDGVHYGTAKTYRGLSTSKLRINGWGNDINYRITGYLSDFRIYATALSTDQIKYLYNSTIKITKNGTLITNGEVIE